MYIADIIDDDDVSVKSVVIVKAVYGKSSLYFIKILYFLLLEAASLLRNHTIIISYMYSYLPYSDMCI